MSQMLRLKTVGCPAIIPNFACWVVQCRLPLPAFCPVQSVMAIKKGDLVKSESAAQTVLLHLGAVVSIQCQEVHVFMSVSSCESTFY